MTRDDELRGTTASRALWGSPALGLLAKRSDFPVVLLDAAGSIVYINPFALTRLGVGEDEALGATPAELAHPQERAEIERLMGVVMEVSRSGERRVWEGTARALGARVEGTLELIPTGNGEVVCVGVAHDGEERTLERALATVDERALSDSEMVCHQTPTGVITYMSKQVEHLMGYAPEQLMGYTPMDFMVPEDAARIFEQYVSWFRGDEVEKDFVFRMVHRDGTLLWWEGRTRRVFGDDGVTLEGAVTTLRNITARRQQERMVATVASSMQALFEGSETTFVLLNREGVVLSCNEMANRFAERLLGHGLEEGRSIYDQLPEPLALGLREFAARVHAGETISTVEEMNFEGESYWWETTAVPFKPSGGPIEGLCFSSRDITRFRRSEAAMRRQAELLDVASDAIAVFEPSGRIAYWNRSSEQLLGWPAEEAVGAMMWEVFGLGELDVRQHLEDVSEGGAWRGRLECVTRAGAPRLMESSWTLVDGGDGEGRAILAISTDVTEAQALKRQFLRSQRLESVALLAGGIAHDLNNVLSPVPIYTHMLREELDGKEEPLADIQAIESSVERATELVQSILEFSRGSTHSRRVPVRWDGLIERLHRTVLKTFPKSIRVVLELRARELTVIGEPTQLEQALLNLCVNARDAMSAGGRLRISLDMVGDDALRPAQLEPGRYAVVTVEDTGEGIDAHVLEEIFAPFYTTKPPGQGTGLGLATTHRIVSEHAGAVTVSSEVGVGSRFAIWMPCHEANAAEEEPAAAGQLPRGAGEHIVVVEDEDALRVALTQTLEHHGYRVTSLVLEQISSPRVSRA